MDNSVKKKKIFVVTFMICLTSFAIGLVCYDKYINKEKPPVPTPTPTEKIVDDKITDFNRIIISEENQVVSIGDKEYKIKKEISVDGVFLLINDEMKDAGASEIVYADFAYVTNKFILFTLAAQDGEVISYVMDKDGNEMEIKEVGVIDSSYQMHDFKIVDGIIEASGHIFCGLDGDCPDKVLIIKNDDNAITVMPKES